MTAITNTLAALTIFLAAGLLAQIDGLIEEAKKGGTLGGQALLFLVVIALVWAVRHQYRENRAETAKILAASNAATAAAAAAADAQRTEDRKHHEALVAAYRLEREGYAHERTENFQTLLRIAGESSRALEATAAAINAQVAATNSLREAIHGVKNELQVHQLERDERNEKSPTR